MLTKCCRYYEIVVVTGLMILGAQTTHASMGNVGRHVSFIQSSAYAVQGHQQTWWWYWWKPKPNPNQYPYQKPTKSVPVPTSLVSAGIGMTGILIWRVLRRRDPR